MASYYSLWLCLKSGDDVEMFEMKSSKLILP